MERIQPLLNDNSDRGTGRGIVKIIKPLLIAASIILFSYLSVKIGYSPLIDLLKPINTINQKLQQGPAINISSDYISPLQYKIDVLHYDLSIDLYPEKKLLKGETVITIALLEKGMEQIDLNFYDNMVISSFQINDEESSFNNSGTRLTGFLPSDSPDTISVKVIYEGTPKRAGLSAFVFGEINGESLVYNLSEPTFSSTWFPCSDRPDDKALLDIKITNESYRTSVSNGILADSFTVGDRKTFHWKTIYPISTYLICVYSSNYSFFNDYYISQDQQDTLEIQYYVLPGQEEKAKIDFAAHEKMFNFLASAFGEYPFIKEKYGVAVFLWNMGAMEHQTITGIGANFILGKNHLESLYLHELAHHWWGNAVGPKNWNDIWLNEGFATYSEALYQEWYNGKKALQARMLGSFNDNFKGILGKPGTNLFSSIVYEKGAWVLHMLRWEIGDSAFFSALRDYFETFKYSNASTADFREICEKVSGKDLEFFFEQWVYREGEINLNFSWEHDAGKLILNLQQSKNLYIFPLEIKIDLKNGEEIIEIIRISKMSEKLEIQVESPPKYITLDPNDWLLANIREMKNE
jgi:aminopeptidase N